MNSKFVKSLVYSLIGLMTLSLMSACTKQDEVVEETIVDINLDIVTSSADPSEAQKNVFNAQLIDYSNPGGNYVVTNNAYGVVDGSYYVVSTINDSSDNNIAKLALSKLSVNNGIDSYICLDVTDDTEYVPSEIIDKVNETNRYFATNMSDGEYTEATYSCSLGYSNVYILDDGCVMGIVEYYYSFYSAVDYSSLYSTERYLCKWDKAGNLSWSVNAREKDIADTVIINKTLLVGTNYICVSSIRNTAYKMNIYDLNGNVICNKDINENSLILNVEDILKTKDNKYVAFYKSSDGFFDATYIDKNSGDLSGDIILPDYLVLNGYTSISEGYDSDFVFSDGIGMYSADFNSNTFNVVMDYVNSDFDGFYVDEIAYVSNTQFYAIYNTFDSYSLCIASFNANTGSTITDNRAIVILGSYKLDGNSRKKILDFNRENEIYRIIVRDYSYYDSIDNTSNGCKLLEEEILAGTGPDLTMVNPGLVNTYSLANNGKLIPWSYLVNADANFSGGDYMNPIMDAYAINGLDYIYVYDFRYRTFIGNADLVGTAYTWSVTDFTKALNKAPSDDAVMFEYITQQDYLDKLISFSACDYIDYENKKTYFNTSDFIDLLKYGASLPIDAQDSTEIYSSISTSYRNGNVLLKEEILVTVDGFWNDVYRMFDGNAGIVGFPSAAEQTSILEFVDTPIMIMNENNINGAWTFTKTFYDYNSQKNLVNAIPVSYTVFDAWGDEGLVNDNYSGINELGETFTYIGTYYYDGSEHIIPNMTTDNIEAIKSLILTNAKAGNYDVTIRNIIEDEANACFSGSQTAKQAASNIDRRVTEYLFN